MRAATRHYARSNGFDQEEPQEVEQDSAAEAKKQALEAFLEKHEGLDWVEWKSAQYGTLRESQGTFAVLHMGRGRLVLHDFKTEQALSEFLRTHSSDRGESLGR